MITVHVSVRKDMQVDKCVIPIRMSAMDRGCVGCGGSALVYAAFRRVGPRLAASHLQAPSSVSYVYRCDTRTSSRKRLLRRWQALMYLALGRAGGGRVLGGACKGGH
jgi:hypothetical protein